MSVQPISHADRPWDPPGATFELDNEDPYFHPLSRESAFQASPFGGTDHDFEFFLRTKPVYDDDDRPPAIYLHAWPSDEWWPAFPLSELGVGEWLDLALDGRRLPFQVYVKPDTGKISARWLDLAGNVIPPDATQIAYERRMEAHGTRLAPADRPPVEMTFQITRVSVHFHPRNPAFAFAVKFDEATGSPRAIDLYDAATKQWWSAYDMRQLRAGEWVDLTAPGGGNGLLPVQVYLNPDRRTMQARWIGEEGEIIPPGRYDKELSPDAAQIVKDARLDQNYTLMDIIRNT